MRPHRCKSKREAYSMCHEVKWAALSNKPTGKAAVTFVTWSVVAVTLEASIRIDSIYFAELLQHSLQYDVQFRNDEPPNFDVSLQTISQPKRRAHAHRYTTCACNHWSIYPQLEIQILLLGVQPKQVSKIFISSLSLQIEDMVFLPYKTSLT